jgi:hypothetical protein
MHTSDADIQKVKPVGEAMIMSSDISPMNRVVESKLTTVNTAGIFPAEISTLIAKDTT